MAAPAAAAPAATASGVVTAEAEGGEGGGGAAMSRPILIADEGAMSCEHFFIPRHYRAYVESVLIPHGLLMDRVDALASDIHERYGDRVPHLICVLKGGYQFFSDLMASLRTFREFRRVPHLI